jgi:hypothetical protein
VNPAIFEARTVTMSLTRHLDDPASPVRAWFAQRLPHTSSVARDANHEMRGPPGRRDGPFITLGRPTRPPLATTARSPALAGTALDRLARATLVPGALQRIAAQRGAGSIVVGPGIPPAMEIEREAVVRIDSLAPSQRELDGRGWRELAELCLQLARFEQAARSRAAVHAVTERVRSAPPTLDGYRAALVDQVDIDDVALAAPCVAVDLADLRAAGRVVCGPVFALSAQVGGADADVIAGDLLVDFKATSTISIVSRAELWQLAGYALADADDQYGIRRVGIAALRWRRRWTIDLDELLERLAGRRLTRGEARAEFAEATRPVAGRRRLRRRSPRGGRGGDASQRFD